MAVSYVLLATLLLVSLSFALPLDDEDEVDKHFASIDYSKMVGKPSKSASIDFASLKPDQNPLYIQRGYFQGDLLIPEGKKRNGIIDTATRWPSGVIPYSIIGSFSSAVLTRIQQAMKAFTDNTCIRWVKRTTQKDYVTINNDNTGCYASAGRYGGVQDMNLEEPGCTTNLGIIIHELNHVVGFMHEHARQERDDFVTINVNNIDSSQLYNFDKNDPPMSGLGITYDYGSVMHYPKDAFSSNGQDTIVPKKPLNGLVMGQTVGFSQKDIYKINRMYNCTAYKKG